MSANFLNIAKDLWSAADQLRANSGLKSSEYQAPILGLIFLRYVNHKFALVTPEIEGKRTRGTQTLEKLQAAYRSRGALYLREIAQFNYLLNLTDSEDRGKAVIDAMEAIEADNNELKDVLPKNEYRRIDNQTLGVILKRFNTIEIDVKGDIFGYIYQYFLGEFSKSQRDNKGGEFFTPNCLARLIVQITEPTGGRIFDPACGAGGMFVEDIRYLREQLKQDPSSTITIYGQEIIGETVRYCKMNLAVHGISGLDNIREGNSYYEDLHNMVNGVDFLRANPPFNVDEVDRSRLVGGSLRFPFGMPRKNSANYLWISIFYTALTETGRAGFVIANSATDDELEIRKQLIQTGAVDVMIAVGSNFFYTVTLPCTLWFLDKGKAETIRRDKVLFIDARHLYRQVSRALREFKSGCIEKDFISQRFPELENIDGLLVESFIDDYFWDWNEELTESEAVKTLINPVFNRLLGEAEKLVNSIYPLQIYKQITEPLLNKQSEEVQETIRALVRAQVLAKLEDNEGEITLDLQNQTRVKAITRKVTEFQLDLQGKVAEEEREIWLKKQRESYLLSAQKVVLKVLLNQNLLLDRLRSSLPLEDEDVMGSLRRIYEEDLDQVLKLWQDTRRTNHIKIICDIVRAYRNQPGSKPYQDVAGLCKVATLRDIEEKNWSLNPGRYVGVAEKEADNFEFAERLEELNEELELLEGKRKELRERIAENVSVLLETIIK
ncbi:type I restriction-modification system subunit M [Planktothrix agardhii]|uniref:site-specific DNA-methyltransferase (adenine-specific) n=1 Tax=Planktothrix agardhii TaxID=1160 RepID=A0AAD1V7S2_PLAAG|nr:class I SAM-dependent DNA methyltransferase [Planktothrix agardhii]CAD5984639.1 Putative type I restriction enzyme MjaXP M protein [Planktothrix agardhii]